jgi:hypothetical protein
MTDTSAPRYVERQLVTRSDEGDCRAAMHMLEDLPGIRRVCIDPKGGNFYVTFDPRRVSDDELRAVLHQHGSSWLAAGRAPGARSPAQFARADLRARAARGSSTAASGGG